MFMDLENERSNESLLPNQKHLFDLLTTKDILLLFFFSISYFTPKTSNAVNLREILTSEGSIIVKMQEKIEYFFAFNVERKVEVLEKQAEKRLNMAQTYANQKKKSRLLWKIIFR